MAEVKKARLFLRRGTDTDRKTTTLCEGELGYSTDAFRVVVGDGTSAGGRSLGTTVFVSGGPLQHNFHTVLTEASAGGYGMKGDLAIFPAASYQNANNVTVATGRYASTVMMLTADVGIGTSQEISTSWVAVNSGIPWGNLSVSDDDISGDQVHGGDISGDVTFSGTISTTSLTGTSAFIGSLGGTTTRPVVVTSTGQLTATAATAEGGSGAVMADGSLTFLSSPVLISLITAGGNQNDWTVSQGWAAVPDNATIALLQFVWHGWQHSGVAQNHHVFEVREGTATTALTGAAARPASAEAGVWFAIGGANQFSCPLSADSSGPSLQYRQRLEDQTGAGIVTATFEGGSHLKIIGYM